MLTDNTNIYHATEECGSGCTIFKKQVSKKVSKQIYTHLRPYIKINFRSQLNS